MRRATLTACAVAGYVLALLIGYSFTDYPGYLLGAALIIGAVVGYTRWRELTDRERLYDENDRLEADCARAYDLAGRERNARHAAAQTLGHNPELLAVYTAAFDKAKHDWELMDPQRRAAAARLLVITADLPDRNGGSRHAQ
jgi:hypothetical protein